MMDGHTLEAETDLEIGDKKHLCMGKQSCPALTSRDGLVSLDRDKMNDAPAHMRENKITANVCLQNVTPHAF